MKVDPKSLKNGNYHVPLELPNGVSITILIPTKDWGLWFEFKDGDEYGLNLVTHDHYT
jgi:hypothetical protein